ncbi:hemoglobin subunit alpha-3-like [Spea bombifrons]|uniref:hemoglobin subunit alpha-3-like n=1 Tax=Spea bombifrons TaxID=233779 RepID=UPI0023493C41|nr:hemoglobin subunit alpha-3-like [Spea bombifrons]
MKLTDDEKALILPLWEKMAPEAGSLGAEAFQRLFLSFPQKALIFQGCDISQDSPYLFALGEKFINALGDAIKNWDNLQETMASVTDLHVNRRIMPDDYMLLSHCLQVTIAGHFPDDFNIKANAAWNKFLQIVSAVLSGRKV